MTLATQVVRHSRKLKGAKNIILKEPAILARPFSKDISRSYNGTEGKYLDLKPYEFCTKSSNAIGERNAFSSELLGANHSRKGPAKSLPFFGMSMQATPRRLFSTNSDLPPHQAIGMPSLSPTMTEGNIARWLKKEGDKVSPGEVLCEVETDKATVEMECMEEGYLAKIIHGDGSKEIKVELRKELNSLQEVSGGKRLSINDLVIKATALALRKIPQCNSSWMNDFIRQYHNVNNNVAVQTNNGLFVPVIKDADKKGLATIAEEVKVLAQKAKENSLKPEEYEGGTFTVSNLGGPFGIKQFCAIINPPQSAILAVGSAERRVLPGSAPDQFEFGNFMSVTLSCDHRVIDGAVGAEWLRAFKSYIENPQSMLL